MEDQAEIGEKAVGFSSEGTGCMAVGLTASLGKDSIVRCNDRAVGTDRVDSATIGAENERVQVRDLFKEAI